MHFPRSEEPNSHPIPVEIRRMGAAPTEQWNKAHLLGLLLWLPIGSMMLAIWPASIATAVWFLICLLGFAMAERLQPYRKAWHPTGREVASDGLLLLLAAVVDGLIKHGGLLLAHGVVGLDHSPQWLSDWPLLLAVPLAVVVGELGPYVLHRWAHTHAWGWRWHRVHHTPERVNTSNSVRVHPLNLAWNVASRGLLWWGLGFSAEALAWATLFMLLQSVAVHANVRGHIGPLAWLIGSAKAHRWHHSTHAEEALNYGTTVPLWDQLLGTWRHPHRSGPQSVGLYR
jgi:sterol desaturase/sphingolipid hydroxylase (fatty acid hydroxylase superfamily)